MHKFAFRILIYGAQSPCTSATTSAQQNRQNNDNEQTLRRWKKNDSDYDDDDDDEINGPVILKHLLETARFVRIRVCMCWLLFFVCSLPANTGKKIIKN